MPNRYNFITPAKVRVLLVPINNCSLQNFNKFVNLITSNIIDLRLLDLSSNSDLKCFNPITFPEGKIYPEFITSSIDNESLYLHEFEPFRKNFIIIGIGQYNQDSDSQLDNINQLKRIYNSSIVHNIILFNTPEEQLPNSKSPVFLHNGTSTHLTALENIFVEIFNHFLISLDDYASAYSNITLRSPVSITDSHVLTKTINQAQKRLSSGSTSYKASFNNHSESQEKLIEKSKYSGRHLKSIGNLYLLAGKYNESIANFTDSLSILKKYDDFLWLASALEGLSVSLYLSSKIDYNPQLNSNISSLLHVTKSSLSTMENSTKRSSLDSNGSKVSIQSPRNSMTSSTTTNGFALPLTSSIDINSLPLPELLKIFLTKAIYFYSQSTNDPENMVPDVVYIECILRKINLMIDHTPESFSTQDIICDIDKIFFLQLVDLNIIDQCNIYNYISLIYDKMKFFRKKAFILRINLVALVKEFEKFKNLKLINQLLEKLFLLYGINSEPENNSINQNQLTWTSLQIQVLKLSLNSAEKIGDQNLLLQLCLLLLSKYTHCLSQDDQIKLRTMTEKIVNSTNSKLPYWDPFLIRKVKFVSARAKEGLIPLVEEVKTKQNQPFFDPYNQITTNEDMKLDRILIKDEINQLKITFQNPFLFPIEINDIKIKSKGVEIETIKSITYVNQNLENQNYNNKLRNKVKRNITTTNLMAPVPSNPSLFTIQPASNEQIIIPFKPLGTGELEITGLEIVVNFCERQFFKIVDQEKQINSINTKRIDSSSPIISELIKNLQNEGTDKYVTYRTLPLTVIPPQPQLKLVELSIPNGWIMLLEGEKYQFEIKLINDSNEIIDYLSFSYIDSSIEYINKNLQQQQYLTASEIYELEWNLFNFKSFKILNKNVINKNIQPNEEIIIKYELTSRKYMRDSKIILDYGHNEIENSFIKQLDIPIHISVMPSLEIVGCDIISSYPIENFEMEDKSKYCILVLDLRNSWTEKLKCDLKYNNFNISDSIESNKTKRYFIPIHKIELSNPTKDIPSLRKKQFIRDYNMTDEEQIQMKKTFWLKQELLKNLSGNWSTDTRSGIIDLRCFRLTSKMVNLLILEPIEISTRIIETNKDLLIDEFYTLETKIINNSNNELKGFIRQLPIQITSSNNNTNNNSNINITKQLSIDRKILFNGVLQYKFKIQPNSTYINKLNFVIIEKGEYEWGTILDSNYCISSTLNIIAK
ncbi:TRS120 [Candida pseudojiufengensis]|uniref:TRS120 n=1 Tax=Candida pseudojiufengensis TaxID=497109 RepID=UPI0022251F7C|nr:TRS120 [Candida pseudojiufengensis]KAI5959272.1 TRS120 [Candida pseudojiufengensis]